MKLTRLSFILLALAGLAFSASAEEGNTARPGGKLPKDVKVALVKVAGDFVDPVNVAVPRDGSGRVFVCERPGVVRIIKDGKVLPKPFLDIHETVVSSFLEQGLYDIEFHPDFKTNGKFYIHYSDMWFNGDSFIVEYKVSAKNPDKADPDSARVIMQIEQTYANHNGGELVFGPDGYLYIGSGDGGWEGDVLNAGQDLTTPLAKVLRIDVNTSTPDRAYGIPADNPLVTPKQLMVLFGVSEEAFNKIHPTARPEIWAYGLRNPLKMQFDRKTGDLYLADVGQNHWEEVNMQPAGAKGGENYGWKFMCGTQPFPLPIDAAGKPLPEAVKNAPRVGLPPIAEYSHVDQGNCVVGLGIYRGEKYPALDGVYFVGDWGSGILWGLARDASGKWQMEQLLDTKIKFTGAGEAEDGTIYVTNATANYGGPVDPHDSERGAVWMLVPADKVPAGAETVPLD
ncbi:MAG: PQQ-dependent sugar dehydrogenase [Verrucomicrobiales bacterium]